MLRRVVYVVNFRWWPHGAGGEVGPSLKAFDDRVQAANHLRRCYRRRLPFGPHLEGGGGISEKIVTLPTLSIGTVRKLWVVRVAKAYPDDEDVPGQDGFGVEGVFASPEEADAFRSELETKAAESGFLGPLLQIGDLDRLLGLSDFDPSVFGDWLTDHGIMTLPDPAQGRRGWRRWVEALTREQVADLSAALHRLRFYEAVEAPFIVGEYWQEQWDEWERDLLGPDGAEQWDEWE
jgi:hypothetical protein